MIQTFNALSQADGDPHVTSQAGGIGLALFATALGLLIAIPLVFAHVLLRAWVARFEKRLKYAGEQLVDLVYPQGQPEADGEAAPAPTGAGNTPSQETQALQQQPGEPEASAPGGERSPCGADPSSGG
jgi:hypothetical protein